MQVGGGNGAFCDRRGKDTCFLYLFCIFSVTLTADGVSVSQGQSMEGVSPQKAQIPILVLSSSKLLPHLLALGGRTWEI